MTASPSMLEREALDELERRLVAQGYILVREPMPADLPAFFGGFRPDAIATGRTPNLLVAVIARRGSGEAEATKIKQLQKLLSGHADWRLEVVYTAPTGALPRVAPVGAVRKRFDQVKELARIDRPAALIMAWSLLEALGRGLTPDRAARSLAPATTVELLTSLGYIEQPEANMLREAVRSRNLIVHGDVEIGVTESELERVLDIVASVLERVDEAQGTSSRAPNA